jgi:hypothetical protein
MNKMEFLFQEYRHNLLCSLSFIPIMKGRGVEVSNITLNLGLRSATDPLPWFLFFASAVAQVSMLCLFVCFFCKGERMRHTSGYYGFNNGYW